MLVPEPGPSPMSSGPQPSALGGSFSFKLARGPSFAAPRGAGATHAQRSVSTQAAVRPRRHLYGGDDGDAAGGAGPGDLQRRRAAVIQYVRDVQPGEVQAFIDEAPPTVVQAMKQTVTNMVGALPPQHFTVTITTMAESLASLMNTMLRTGYLLRGVQYQLELELALQSAAASMMQHAAQQQHQQHQQQQQQEEQQAEVVHEQVPLPPPSPAASSASSTGSVLNFAPEPCLPAAGNTSSSNGNAALIPEVLGAPAGSSAAAAGPEAAGTSLAGWSQPEEHYAPGVQLSRVDGDVLRWHMQHGLERMPAASYIRFLEQKVQQLQQQVQQQAQAQQQQQQQQQQGASPSGFQPYPPLFTSSASAAGAAGASAAAAATAASMLAGGEATAAAAAAGGPNNPVLAYLRSLDAPSLAALGACGPDVSDAMSLFVTRLMGTADQEQLRAMTSEFSALDLSKLMFWLLVVGWSLRAMEVRLEVEEGFGSA